jgi:quinol monooxygenase YgiN
LQANLSRVRAEKGCVEYFPAVDVDAKFPQQLLDENTVTILEKWESLEALHNHIKTPHMARHFAEAKDMVENISIKILQEVR